MCIINYVPLALSLHASCWTICWTCRRQVPTMTRTILLIPSLLFTVHEDIATRWLLVDRISSDGEPRWDPPKAEATHKVKLTRIVPRKSRIKRIKLALVLYSSAREIKNQKNSFYCPAREIKNPTQESKGSQSSDSRRGWIRLPRFTEHPALSV